MHLHTLLTFAIFLLVASAIKSCREHERVLVFRLGKLILPPRGPGIFLIIPIVDKMHKINLRSKGDLEEAERLLWEAKMQEGANQIEIEKHLSEFSDIRRNLKNQENDGRETNQPGVQPE